MTAQIPENVKTALADHPCRNMYTSNRGFHRICRCGHEAYGDAEWEAHRLEVALAAAGSGSGDTGNGDPQ